ncbi:MAG TPA: fibronectin type III domain-containing protein, partial [Solirubrobacteraceae bacterium]|nr:fibronectin type III domain-containing protein [Solirubrobacteraceae bacterium]
EDPAELDAAFATSFGAPVAKTEPATSVTSNSAMLNAFIEPSGGETTYHLEYGTTKSYGTSVPVPDASLESDSKPQSIDEAITGLQSQTTYHYRIVASNGAGQAVGKDVKFKTG